MAAENYAVTVAGAGDKSGRNGGEMDWQNAMGMAEWLTDMTDNAEAGDVYYVEEGTYTLVGAFSTARNGTDALPINIIGVLSGTSNEPPIFSDHAFAANRPLIACAANSFVLASYWIIKNIDFTTTETNGVKGGTGFAIYNCKSDNSGAATRYGFNLDSIGRAYGCEAISDNGWAFRLNGGGLVLACYAHDSVEAYYVSGTTEAIVNCIADTCTNGITLFSRNAVSVIHCTIYNCSNAGIRGSTAKYCNFLNNIIDACGTGADWSGEIKSNYWDYNCWDNTSDTTNVTKGDNAQTGDPGLNNPANGDFSVTTGDAKVHNLALDVGDLTGATV